MAKRKKDKGTNNDLQNITQKTKGATRTPLKTGGEFKCSGWMGGSFSTFGTRCVTLVTNPVIRDDLGKVRIVTTNRTNPWTFVTQIFRNG